MELKDVVVVVPLAEVTGILDID